MAETLRFAVTHNYDTRKAGITVDVLLRLGGKEVEVVTKLDTGRFVFFDASTANCSDSLLKAGDPKLSAHQRAAFLPMITTLH